MDVEVGVCRHGGEQTTGGLLVDRFPFPPLPLCGRTVCTGNPLINLLCLRFYIYDHI